MLHTFRPSTATDKQNKLRQSIVIEAGVSILNPLIKKSPRSSPSQNCMCIIIASADSYVFLLSIIHFACLFVRLLTVQVWKKRKEFFVVVIKSDNGIENIFLSFLINQQKRVTMLLS